MKGESLNLNFFGQCKHRFFSELLIFFRFKKEESRATKSKGGVKQAPVTVAPIEVTSAAAAAAAAASDDDEDVDLFDFGIFKRFFFAQNSSRF